MPVQGKRDDEPDAGEVASRCRDEPTNFLVVNLVHDVVSDQKSVEEARAAMTEGYAKLDAGGRPEYAQGIQFDVPDRGQRDPGTTTLTEDVRRYAERIVE